MIERTELDLSADMARIRRHAPLLEWLDDRWHLDGQGIHAGDCLEVRWPDGTWEAVRIESSDHGQKLYAYIDHHGLPIGVRVDPGSNDPLPLRQITKGKR